VLGLPSGKPIHESLFVSNAVGFFLTFLAITLLFFVVAYFIHSRNPSLASAAEFRPELRGLDLVLVAPSPALLGAYIATMAAAFGAVGWLLVRRTFAPIVSLNDQLDTIDPNNLQIRVKIETHDNELRELEEHINGLLSRISLSFHQLQSYSAQVAHELRAPLTIIRLKIEEAANKIDPALAEEIQTELLRLTMHVELALLVARAEQGHLRPNRVRFDLAALLEDIAQDFRLLARDQGRQIEVTGSKAMISADPKYMKQILYSLLTNCLRHGRGKIYTVLQSEGNSTTLAIKNRVKTEDTDEPLDLGLGRRIVIALAALQQNVEVHTNRQEGWYEVRLMISDVAVAQKETLGGGPITKP
jgi:signal transduction histidine kinase